MDDQLKAVQNILLEAVEIADARERAAFLSRACGADLSLRQEVEELLRAEAEAGQFLPEQPGTSAAQAALADAAEELVPHPIPAQVPFTEKPGDRIGRYKLLQKIGEGGCGVVYMAEQEEPVRRKVALKVIKVGMDTKSVVARFEAERQALALMDHPNIARVLDAGATTTGRPFFVMELVRGIKITNYCNQNHLPTRERLGLFIRVCQAVQHAHQKGIIHRDLKPSNILVTVNDSVPVPKVIDFGIAKATEGRLTDQTLFTAFEQFLGTPPYMSPEQAAMTSLDIDTRSDIYSLGVLLYELLTGKTPFDTKALLASGLDELRRTIRETEPVRPSTRLTMDLGAADGKLRPQPAIDRGSSHRLAPEQRNLINLIRGDLDAIVMKCLEKDRARRYETANGLARDIQRHLDNEPVLARPPSRLYEFQKTVRRHKGGFAAAAAIMVALAAGAVVSTVEAVRAKQAEQEQSHLQLEAAEHQRQAEQNAQKASIAEADAKEKLWASYLAQAQAGRWSRRAGRRFDGLEVLKKAAAIHPSLALRNEAIACMALADVRMIKSWQAFPEDSLVGFDGNYECYAFGDNQGNAHLCRLEDAKELRVFPNYEPPFKTVELSPDGRYLFIAGGKDASRVEILDLERKELCLRLSEPHFRAMRFTRDTRFLAIAYERQELNWPIRIFDLSLRKEISSFPHGTLPYYIRFDPKHFNQLLTSDGSRTVRVWDWQKGKVEQTFEHPEGVLGIDWHPDGETVATGCEDNKVRLWDTVTGKQRVALPGHETVPRQLWFNSDGVFLITSDWDGMLRVWDARAQHELLSAPVAGYAFPFSISRDQFAVGLGAGKLGILEAVSSQGYREFRSRLAPDDGCTSCDFSPDGGSLLCSDTSGMRLWDVASRSEIGAVTEADSFEHFAFFHPDGASVFLTASNGVQNWVLDERRIGKDATFKLRRTLGLGHRYNHLALSRDGGTLAVGTSSEVDVFDALTGAQIQRLNLAHSEVLIALSADGQTAATWAPLSQNVQVWDVGHSNLLHEIPAHDVSIHVVFSPNGQSIVVGDGAEYDVWDRRTWQSLYVLPRTAASTWARMAFSPDSTLLAVAITRSTLRLVEAATGHELATLEPPERSNIGWIAFSSNSTQLAVTTKTGPIQLWDLRLIRQQLASMKLDWELPPYQ